VLRDATGDGIIRVYSLEGHADMDETYDLMTAEAGLALADALGERLRAGVDLGHGLHALTLAECRAAARDVVDASVPKWGSPLMNLVASLPTLMFEDTECDKPFDTPIAMFRKAVVNDMCGRLDEHCTAFCREQFLAVTVETVHDAFTAAHDAFERLVHDDPARIDGGMFDAIETLSELRGSLDAFVGDGTRRSFDAMVERALAVGARLASSGSKDFMPIGRHAVEMAAAAETRPEMFRPAPPTLRIVA
jgi:hypothetical protein